MPEDQGKTQKKEYQTIREQVLERVRKEEVYIQQIAKKDSDNNWFDRFVMKCVNAYEYGHGALYVYLNKGIFAFNHRRGCWMYFNGVYWVIDTLKKSYAAVETSVVHTYLEFANKLGEQILEASRSGNEQSKKTLQATQNNIIRTVRRLRAVKGISDTLSMAITNEENLGLVGDEFDNHNHLLACSNVIINLELGENVKAKHDYYLSKASPTEYKGLDEPAPVWEKTLSEIFDEDNELIAYLQRLFGYAITGRPCEHIFPVFYGQGRNGKSLIVSIINYVLGPLSGPIQAEMLLDSGRAKNASGPSPEVMALRGLRIAFASETDDGRRFSPAKVKWLTGGDELVGRFPHDKEETRFNPTHTLFLLTNHKPHAPASDFAFWERVHLIPFKLSFVNREPASLNERRAQKGLLEELKKEASGILAWMVLGCLLYQKHGLNPPESVVNATKEYHRDEDVLADFFEECCDVAEYASVQSKSLYDCFSSWYEENVGKRVPSPKWFGKQIKGRFEKEKRGGVIMYYGLELKKQQIGSLG